MAPTVVPTLKITGFAPIPLSILLDRHLSPESKLTYLIIRTHDRGNGCFACRETLAVEIGLSPYHIRKGIGELLERGILTLEKRRMGLTDLIRLTDHDWGLPNPSEAELTEPEFELPPEPELPEEPLLPIQPVEVEVDLVEEPDEVEVEPVEEPVEAVEEPVEAAEEPDEVLVEVESEPDEEPDEDAVKPLELGREDVSSPSSNDLNYKYNASKKDASKYNTPCTKPESTEPSPKATEKLCDELVSFFYESKENRQPTQNELVNWRATAKRLLDEFTLEELQEATRYAIDQGARLFYYVALVAPDYIVKRRQQQAAELQHAQIDSKALSQEQQRQHQLEALRSSTHEFDVQTRNLLTGLEERMRPQTFRTWFREAFIVNYSKDSLTLALPSSTMAEWITQRYTALLQEVSGKTHIEIISAEEGSR